jgi:hypothetical protein
MRPIKELQKERESAQIKKASLERIVENPPTKNSPELKIAERPKPVNPEKVLFVMPTDEELFIAALSVIQNYQAEMRKRELVQIYYINSENIQLNFLLDVIDEHYKVASDELVNHRRFDLVFKFDAQTAYNVSISTEKHATTSFGIQLGVEPSSLANLSVLPWPEVTHDVLLCSNLPEKLREDIRELLMVKVTGTTIMTYDGKMPPATRVLDCVGRCKVIVGVRSLETYVAACCENKGVVEIYPKGVHRRWLSKWTCPRYQMIAGTPEAVTAELVFKGLESLWVAHTYRPSESLVTTAQ